MEYLFENAADILKLAISLALICFSIALLMLCRTIIILTQILKKVNDVTDLFIVYLQKPVAMILSAERAVSRFIKWFKD